MIKNLKEEDISLYIERVFSELYKHSDLTKEKVEVIVDRLSPEDFKRLMSALVQDISQMVSLKISANKLINRLYVSLMLFDTDSTDGRKSRNN